MYVYNFLIIIEEKKNLKNEILKKNTWWLIYNVVVKWKTKSFLEKMCTCCCNLQTSLLRRNFFDVNFWYQILFEICLQFDLKFANKKGQGFKFLRYPIRNSVKLPFDSNGVESSAASSSRRKSSWNITNKTFIIFYKNLPPLKEWKFLELTKS